MVLTVSTGLCTRPRLWQRQGGLVSTCRTPISVEKALFLIHPNISCLIGCFRLERREWCSVGGTRENAQTCDPGLVSDYVHTQLQGKKTVQRDVPEAWKRPSSPCQRHLLYWLHRRPVALVWVWFQASLTLHVPDPLLGFFQRRVLSRLVPLHPDLRAPVWCSSCPSRCSPGQRCPVRR